MTTDTPRTDAILMECPSHLQEVALANLGMDLERELVASKAEVERLKANLRRAVKIAVNLSYDYADTEYDDELDQLKATMNHDKK